MPHYCRVVHRTPAADVKSLSATSIYQDQTLSGLSGQPYIVSKYAAVVIVGVHDDILAFLTRNGTDTFVGFQGHLTIDVKQGGTSKVAAAARSTKTLGLNVLGTLGGAIRAPYSALKAVKAGEQRWSQQNAEAWQESSRSLKTVVQHTKTNLKDGVVGSIKSGATLGDDALPGMTLVQIALSTSFAGPAGREGSNSEWTLQYVADMLRDRYGF